MKTALVTGGAGFVGSHLCERLLRDGYRVISLDNYFTGTEANHAPGIEYRRGHTKDIATLVPDVPDIIFHLGEYARVEKSFDDLALVWDLNMNGTFGVLEYCRTNNVAKLVYAGSSTKFADEGKGRDQGPYAWSKATNTDLVKNYGEWFGLNYAITYFYNVYGSRERSGTYGTLISIFDEQMKQGEPLTVVEPGTQMRNFTHVDDIIDGIALVGEKGIGDEFGIGSPESFSVLEVAQLFGGEVTMIPARKGNRMNASVMSDRTKALGWEPTHSLVTYIEKLKRAYTR